MSTRLISGRFPRRLYKAFGEESHARAFVDQGIIRLSSLDYYQSIEDTARADRTEGEARLRVKGNVRRIVVGNGPTREEVTPGYVQYTGNLLNAVYILCSSKPPKDDRSKLPTKFGKFVVQIDDPKALALDMAKAIVAEDKLGVPPIVRFCKVTYDKNTKLEREPDPRARRRLTYTQKPARFSDEYEYRFAVLEIPGTLDPPLGSHYTVRFGHPLGYATLLPPLVAKP